MTQAPFIIGLTGGIASGKTTVANLFKSLDIDVIDADIAAREVVKPGTEGLTAITEHFGKSILNPDGTLNRAKLRNIIFDNDEQRLWLNTLLHPRIRQWMKAQTDKAESAYVIHAIPLLVESSLQDRVDRILVVDTVESVQIKRLMQRDEVSQETAENILSKQISREARLQHADYIIDNNSPKKILEDKVNSLHNEFLRLAKLNSN